MTVVAAHPSLRAADLRPISRASRMRDLVAGLDLLFTYNGRGAIYQVLRSLPSRGRRTVLAPAFHCPTVVDPILHAGCDVKFYAVDEWLHVDREELLERLSGDVLAVVVINYFGIEEDLNDIFVECKRRGIAVVEDCSHSFLRTNPLELAGSRGDAAVFSFWKQVPCRVGGGIRFNAFPRVGVRPARAPMSAIARLARGLVGDLCDDASMAAPRRVLEVLRRSGRRQAFVDSAEGPVEHLSAHLAYPYDRVLAESGMPALARMVLYAAGLESIAAARRAHFAYWVGTLRDDSSIRRVVAELPPRSCPWGFPVVLGNRRDNDYRLRARGVPLFTFGEVLHPAVDEPDRASRRAAELAHFLADHLLVLGVHHQLDDDTLERAGAELERFEWAG